MNAREKRVIDRVFGIMDQRKLLQGGGRYTGCNYRAHLGGALLQAFGLKARKVWLYGEGFDHTNSESTIKCTKFRLHEPGLCPYSNFHVIPAAVTKEGRHVLIDPTFYDAPVSLFQASSDFRQVANDEPALFKVTRLNTTSLLIGGEEGVSNIPESIAYAFESVLELRKLMAQNQVRDDLARIPAFAHDEL